MADICSICQYEVDENRFSKPDVESCRDKFHHDCLTKWTLSSNKCPGCRVFYASQQTTCRVDDEAPVVTTMEVKDIMEQFLSQQALTSQSCNICLDNKVGPASDIKCTSCRRGFHTSCLLYIESRMKTGVFKCRICSPSIAADYEDTNPAMFMLMPNFRDVEQRRSMDHLLEFLLGENQRLSSRLSRLRGVENPLEVLLNAGIADRNMRNPQTRTVIRTVRSRRAADRINQARRNNTRARTTRNRENRNEGFGTEIPCLRGRNANGSSSSQAIQPVPSDRPTRSMQFASIYANRGYFINPYIDGVVPADSASGSGNPNLGSNNSLPAQRRSLRIAGRDEEAPQREDSARPLAEQYNDIVNRTHYETLNRDRLNLHQTGVLTRSMARLSRSRQENDI